MPPIGPIVLESRHVDAGQECPEQKGSGGTGVLAQFRPQELCTAEVGGSINRRARRGEREGKGVWRKRGSTEVRTAGTRNV